MVVYETTPYGHGHLDPEQTAYEFIVVGEFDRRALTSPLLPYRFRQILTANCLAALSSELISLNNADLFLEGLEQHEYTVTNRDRAAFEKIVAANTLGMAEAVIKRRHMMTAAAAAGHHTVGMLAAEREILRACMDDHMRPHWLTHDGLYARPPHTRRGRPLVAGAMGTMTEFPAAEHPELDVPETMARQATHWSVSYELERDTTGRLRLGAERFVAGNLDADSAFVPSGPMVNTQKD